ncbi:MAG: hypothetical protein KC418_08305 [Anaerolineales bacterium]|nr:hypothetical protein [Anaerolineales bacterium]MCB8951949.1 hypothetical protein [Ardenticatenales bacterium]
MARQSYTPVAPYADLKRAETLLNAAATTDDVRQACAKEGAKIGYKAFCYLLLGKMTPEGMKPDDACLEAARLETAGESAAALEIYRRVLDAHPDHPIAKKALA